MAQAGTGENATRTQISFGLLLNLVAVANSEDKAVLWAFLQRYAPDVSAQTHPRLDALVGYAIAYFRDFVKPAKHYRPADEVERQAFSALADALAALPDGASAETVQDTALDIARAIPRYQNFQAKSATPERPPSPANGGRRSIRCCSARRSRARASAPSRRSTGWRTLAN